MYFDTTANVHMTNDPCKLTNLVPYTGTTNFMIGDGSKLSILDIEDSSLNSKFSTIKFSDVLVVPKLIFSIVG